MSGTGAALHAGGTRRRHPGGGPGLHGCAWGPGARPCKRRCWRAACLILQPRSCNCDLLNVLFRCAVAMLDTAVEVKARLKSGDNSFKPFAGGPAGWRCLSSLAAGAAAAALIAPCIAAQWQLHSGIACADVRPAAGSASALLHREGSFGARPSALYTPAATMQLCRCLARALPTCPPNHGVRCCACCACCAGKSMAMIFTKPSMRTRVSFETVSGSGAHTRAAVRHACLCACSVLARAPLAC